MEYFPAPLEKLVEQFARLPGIGGKSVVLEKLGHGVVGVKSPDAEEDIISRFFELGVYVQNGQITFCPVMLTDADFHSSCLSPLASAGSPKKPAFWGVLQCCWIKLFKLLIIIFLAARGILIRAECCQHCRQKPLILVVFLTPSPLSPSSIRSCTRSCTHLEQQRQHGQHSSSKHQSNAHE